MLSALTRPDHIAQAWETTLATLARGAVTTDEGHLNWPGPHPGYDAIFHRLPLESAWVAPLDVENRLRLHLGVATNIVPSVEVNVNKVGDTWRTEGAFGRDGAGTIYLFHSGRLGGGTPGVTGKNLLEHISWRRPETLNSLGKTRKGAAFGPIDSSVLIEDFASYARAAADFKG